MNIGVSNLAWPVEARRAGMQLLAQHGVTNIELAPAAYFGGWDDISPERLVAARTELAEFGLHCTAMQGILHGVADAHLFASAHGKATLRAHLSRVAALAGEVGAKACVFGSPRQRDRGSLDPAQAFDEAAAFMRDVAPVFQDAGTTLAIEANARIYGCNFLVTTREAADFVRAVDHPGCRLQLDTGTVFLEDRSTDGLAELLDLVVHTHISEPQLAPIGQLGSDHAAIATTLRDAGYDRSISIEMTATEPWRDNLVSSLGIARRIYA